MPRRGEPSRERTPEERARAAAERAARRGQAAPPPETFEHDAVAPPAPPAPPPAPAPPATETVRRARAAASRPAPPPPPARRLERRAAKVDPPASRNRPAANMRVRALALLALATIAAALWAINETFQPLHGDGSGAVRVRVPPGADAGRIGDILATAGVVDSGSFFNLNATLTLRRGKLRPGNYTLRRDMSYGGAIEALMQGPKAKVVRTTALTIPEGLSRREVAPRVKKAGLAGDYVKETQSRRRLRQARRLGLPRSADSLEGFLFPATYELVEGAAVSDLVDKQLEAFADNLAELDLRAARRANLTRYDVVIIASMVEREAQLDKERPLIAAVIYNRLREGMTLGIDATIRYAFDNWSRPLRVSELESDSPYNTRRNRGLPPTPIGNPGLASLKAAARPADVDYLFYVVKPGRCGEHAFSSTDAQFAQDRARYDRARAKAGGRSPTKC